MFDDEPVPASYSAATTTAAAAPSSSLHDGSFSGGAAAEPLVRLQPGQYAAVEIVEGSGGTLRGRLVARTTLREFVGRHGAAVGAVLQQQLQEQQDQQQCVLAA